jgi:hypothetical protein
MIASAAAAVVVADDIHGEAYWSLLLLDVDKQLKVDGQERRRLTAHNRASTRKQEQPAASCHVHAAHPFSTPTSGSTSL